MLMRDGVMQTLEVPSLGVLEIAQNDERKPDDLLPYSVAYAKFFRKLPNDPKDLSLKIGYVPLNDIECFTKTIIHVPESVIFNRKKGKWQPLRYGAEPVLTITSDVLKLAQDQFLPLCGSWDYDDWDEYDYSRIKSLNFRELMDARKKEGQNAVGKECLKCPNFLKHVSCRDGMSVRLCADCQ
jgi:antiviral helicase SKI2